MDDFSAYKEAAKDNLISCPECGGKNYAISNNEFNCFECGKTLIPGKYFQGTEMKSDDNK